MINTHVVEITRGMMTANYIVRENWVAFSELKKRGVTFNEMRTLVDQGGFEEKTINLQPGSIFFYRRKIKSVCRNCGEYQFHGKETMRECTHVLGHYLIPMEKG